MTTCAKVIDEVVAPKTTAPSSKALAATIFSSSGLLFLIEPMAAKQLLPWFGGGAAVWATCLVFFQCVLLLGYCSSFLLARIKQVRLQLIIQSSLVLCSAVVLWVFRFFPGRPIHSSHPAGDCLLILACNIGLAYFVLSATTPLLQSWCSLTQRMKVPYRLFALSNLASLFALLAYPFGIERWLDLNTQLTIWRSAYIGFAVLFCGTAIQVWRNIPRAAERRSAVPAQTKASEKSNRKAWVALAACSSALLIAVTNMLCQQIAPMPLLWIAPLAVYLITFVLCFDRQELFRKGVYQVLAPLALVGLVWVKSHPNIGLRSGVGISLAALFFLCMFCHGQLAALKPATRYLTVYYVYVALGGALGALFVGLFAPAVFHDLLEVEIGIGFCLVLALRFLFGYRAKMFLALAWLFCIVAVWTAGIAGQIDNHTTTYRGRNFYGILSIREYSDKVGSRMRLLVHGAVLHGAQALAEDEKRQPLTYYSPLSGIGFVLSGGSAARRIGVVGLGAGTLAAYGRPGDKFYFYEINPLVIELAHSNFSYLRDSKAYVTVREGDGRLLLEEEGGQHFDVLVLDAFSGDSIPVHLLTKEAFACYVRHLNPNGLLAVHVSNNYLDLRPIVTNLGAHFKLPAVLIHSEGVPSRQISPADWILLTRRENFMKRARRTKGAEQLQPSEGRLWTDQYSNVLNVLK